MIQKQQGMKETKKTNAAGMQEMMKKQKRRMLRALIGRNTQLDLTEFGMGRGWNTRAVPHISNK